MIDMRSKGWFYLENSLVDRDDLEPMERLLYMVLARHANSRGECFPSQERLLKVTGLKDKRTIKKYMDMLIEKGFIEVEIRPGRSHMYFLKNVPEKEDTPPTKNVPTSNVPTTYNVDTPPTKNEGTTPYIECTPKETKFKETNLRNNTQSVVGVKEIYKEISEITGVNIIQVEQCINPRVLMKLDKDKLLEELKGNEWLREQKGMEGFRRYLSTEHQLNKIVAGYYKQEQKPKEQHKFTGLSEKEYWDSVPGFGINW